MADALYSSGRMETRSVIAFFSFGQRIEKYKRWRSSNEIASMVVHFLCYGWSLLFSGHTCQCSVAECAIHLEWHWQHSTMVQELRHQYRELVKHNAGELTITETGSAGTGVAVTDDFNRVREVPTGPSGG